MKKLFFFLTIPIQKLMQKLAAPDTQITYKDVNKIHALASSGKVLFSSESLHFTSFFIKGKWKHSAMVAFDKELGLVAIEAINGGVQKKELVEWLYDKDKVMIGERIGFTQEQELKAGEFALAQVKPRSRYDYLFTKDNDDWYCSELSADALQIDYEGIIEPTELAEHKLIRPLYESGK